MVGCEKESCVFELAGEAWEQIEARLSWLHQEKEKEYLKEQGYLFEEVVQ